MIVRIVMLFLKLQNRKQALKGQPNYAINGHEHKPDKPGYTMSLEYYLEKFPVKVSLKDGVRVTIRPLEKTDACALQKFFYAVPEPERIFLERPVTDRRYFTQLCAKLDFTRDFTLVMVHGARIIGWMNLRQRQGGWRRHIGSLSLLTHPNYRSRDVARLLLEEIVTAARHVGLWKLEARANGDRTVTIRSLETFGFRKLMHLHDYVIDMTGQRHDFVVLGMDLKTDEEYASAG
jgi:L-amino acid N-acyltransferase YncA